MHKKFRILIIFERKKDIFVPIVIMRKGSKDGENIRKENYMQFLQWDWGRILSEIRQWDFETIIL